MEMIFWCQKQFENLNLWTGLITYPPEIIKCQCSPKRPESNFFSLCVCVILCILLFPSTWGRTQSLALNVKLTKLILEIGYLSYHLTSLGKSAFVKGFWYWKLDNILILKISLPKISNLIIPLCWVATEISKI